MAVKIAINGYGRIGRNILKALFESHRTNELEIVAINDLGDAESNAYLTQYDSAHGTFPFEVEAKDDALIIDGKETANLSSNKRDDLMEKFGFLF